MLSNCLELDNKAISIKIIDDPTYYRVYKSNRTNKLYIKIREAIINEKTKLRGIILTKYSI